MLLRVPAGVVKGPPNCLHSPLAPCPLPLNDLAVGKPIPASLLHGPVWEACVAGVKLGVGQVPGPVA